MRKNRCLDAGPGLRDEQLAYSCMQRFIPISRLETQLLQLIMWNEKLLYDVYKRIHYITTRDGINQERKCTCRIDT